MRKVKAGKAGKDVVSTINCESRIVNTVLGYGICTTLLYSALLYSTVYNPKHMYSTALSFSYQLFVSVSISVSILFLSFSTLALTSHLISFPHFLFCPRTYIHAR